MHGMYLPCKSKTKMLGCHMVGHQRGLAAGLAVRRVVRLRVQKIGGLVHFDGSAEARGISSTDWVRVRLEGPEAEGGTLAGVGNRPRRRDLMIPWRTCLA